MSEVDRLLAPLPEHSLNDVVAEGDATVDAAVPALQWSPQLVLTVIVLPLLFTFKPSEWFLVSYLLEDFRVTLEQIDVLVFPLWTYSFLGFTLLFAVLSAFQLSGKWCLVPALLSGAVGAACLSLFPFAWGPALGLVLASEVFVGLYSAGEVMFSSLLYRLVPTAAHFQHMASFSRGMRLMGQGSAALVAQLLLHFGVSFRVLFYVSFAALSAASVLAVFLRFDWRDAAEKPRSCAGLAVGWRESLLLYRVMEVQQYSVFLLVSNAVHPLVLTYIQSLLQDLQPSIVGYNAYLLAGATLASCGCALLPVLLLRRDQLARANKMLFLAPIVCAALLVLMSNFNSIMGDTVWPSYVFLLLYQCVFEASLVVASATLAVHLCIANLQQYGVLFCLAYAAAVGLQALLQFALQESNLSVRLYFVILGAAYLVLPVFLTGIWLVHTHVFNKTKE